MKKVAFFQKTRKRAVSKSLKNAETKIKRQYFFLEFGKALSSWVQANNLDALAGFCRLRERLSHGEAVRTAK